MHGCGRWRRGKPPARVATYPTRLHTSSPAGHAHREQVPAPRSTNGDPGRLGHVAFPSANQLLSISAPDCTHVRHTRRRWLEDCSLRSSARSNRRQHSKCTVITVRAVVTAHSQCVCQFLSSYNCWHIFNAGNHTPINQVNKSVDQKCDHRSIT